MHAHKIDTVLIRDNVRLEILYESNPYYMNESISLVIRLKHLGSAQTQQHITDRIEELTGKKTGNGKATEEQSKPGIIGSLWKSLNQEQQFKEEEESKLVQDLEKQAQFNSPVELVSFYFQLTGTFQYDPRLVDGNKLHQTSKIVGVGGTHSHGDLLATKIQQFGTDSVAKYVNTDFIESPDDGLRETGEGGHERKEIPLLILPQTLLFTELVMNPGDLKMFYCKSTKLPRSLPPSYTGGRAFKICYNFQVGGIATVGSDMHTMSFNFPLNICSYVDQEGIQYVPKLDKPPFILPPGTVRDIDNGRRRRSTPSAGTLLNRKSSIQSLGEFHLNQEKAKKAQERFKNVASGVDETGDIDKAVEELMLFQFGEAERSDVEEEDDLVDLLGNTDRVTFNFGINRGDTKTSITSEHATQEGEHTTQAFMDLKKNFVVNRDGQKICHINLSKDYYTTCEDIDLVIEFPHDSSFKVTTVTACLQTVETPNPQYLHDNSVPVSQYNILPVYETHHICFDELTRLPIKLMCNRTPNYMQAAQFQNNIFQYKWMISMKFVVVNCKESTPLESFYEDKNGKLYHAKKQLEGEEVNFKIPITVLPSDKQFGGW